MVYGVWIRYFANINKDIGHCLPLFTDKHGSWKVVLNLTKNRQLIVQRVNGSFAFVNFAVTHPQNNMWYDLSSYIPWFPSLKSKMCNFNKN